jgi:signal transduction histidine kinase
MHGTPSDAPLGLSTHYLTTETLEALLTVSLTALTVLLPVYEPDNKGITDFAFDYLNPAGQRMLRLPERPETNFLACFPHARESGMFACCCAAFATGEPGHFEADSLAEGPDDRFYLTAQRQGERLAVSFTDPISQARLTGEMALRKSQIEAESQRRRFAEVLTELPAQIATYQGPDHVFAFANPRYQRYFPGQDLLGHPLREVLPEVGEQGIIARLDQVYRTGEPHHAEAVAVWLDFAHTGQQQQVYLDLFFHPLRDAQGRIYGVLDFSYDVTEQVLARQQVEVLAEQLRLLNQELEQRVKARTLAMRVHARDARHARADAEQQRASLVRFLSQTHAAICVLRGPAHVLDYCNPAFERLFSGRSLPPGRSLAEVFPSAGAQRLVTALDGVYETGTSFFGVEQELTTIAFADQPARPHYFTFSFDAYQEHDHTAGVSIFAYDVTEAVLARRQNDTLQAEALATAQRQAQERATFHQVFEQTPAAICLLREPRHQVEYLNPAYQQLFSGRELLDHSLVDAVPEAAAQGYVALLDEVYRTGETYFGTEMPLVLASPDGGSPTTTYFTFTYQAFQENGQTAGISIFAYDVTEQVLARGQMQALRLEGARTSQQLLRTNTDLDTFIYTASHDLRTPIGNIEGLLAALREELPAETMQTGVIKPLLDRMQRSVERFQLTITQLTDVAKLQQVHSQPAEKVDLGALVEDLRLDLAPELAPVGAVLTVEVATCPYVSFAPKNLRCIVYNLLSNGLKYRHPARPPIVVVRCHSTGPAVVLEVQDNGLGLTDIQQTQLFGLFQRLHDHVAGTGIGLYTVKRLVENAGGTITVQSQIGKGTTFTIILPGNE